MHAINYSQSSLSGCLISVGFAPRDRLVASSEVYVRINLRSKRPKHCKRAVFLALVGGRLLRFDCIKELRSAKMEPQLG